MPALTFSQVSKTFGKSTVISDFTAEVPDKEFLVLLGPSGCGKSTMLRMIAGLTDISGGQLLFDGEPVNGKEPRERNVAFVFQSYALYPHMTVRDNIAFPLIMDRFKKWHHIPILNSVMRRAIAKRPEVRDRVEDVARMLELTNLMDRRPKGLSGGQRQRVAVARSLVRDPAIYLLDEPLSNLDAKLRTQMRAEITALYQRVDKSFVYVTHDQVEAMTMATRIIIMDAGEIQQIGTPDEIYHRPANLFVAKFIGAPPMNLIPVVASDSGITIKASGAVLAPGASQPSGDAILGIRPENVRLSTAAEGGIRGWVTTTEHLGAETLIGFVLSEPNPDRLLQAESGAPTYFMKVPGTARFETNSEQWFGLDMGRASWFDTESGRRVLTQAAADELTVS